MEKLLTIFLTTYNRKNYIRQALDSILSQTYKNFNLVILDNASNDGTSEIIASYKDERITHIRRERNIGPINNAKTAFETASTKYFMITHDDDVMLPDMIEKQIRVMEENDDAILCDVGIVFINKRGESFKSIEEQIKTSQKGLKILNANEFFTGYFSDEPPLSCPTVMLRTEFIKSNNITVREDAGLANDQCLYCEINLQGGKVYRIKDKLYLYRVHDNQDSRNNETRATILEDELYKVLKETKKESLSSYLGKRVNSRLQAWAIMVARKKMDKKLLIDQLSVAKNKEYYVEPSFKQKAVIFLAKNLPFLIKFVYFVTRKVLNKKSEYMLILESND